MAMSLATFFGGSTSVSSGVEYDLDFRTREWRMNITAGSLRVVLPPSSHTQFKRGVLVFIIYNVGSNAFLLADIGDPGAPNDSASVPAGDVAIVSRAGNRWIIDVRDQIIT